MFFYLERPPAMTVKTTPIGGVPLATGLGELTLGYREAGSGPAVLLLHGWPTSSFLWRRVIEPLAAAGHRVIAPDLPGFGASDKPTDVRYGFELFERALDGLLEQLEVDETALVVHDLGGPIGVHWALRRPARVTHLALLNTLLYPEFDASVGRFVTMLSTPGQREQLTSAAGIEAALRLGLADDDALTIEALAGHLAPYHDDDDRLALAHAGIGLEIAGFAEIARRLPSLAMPVTAIYGEQDRILPDVAETMARVQADVPQATLTALPGCGHFLQEEAPDELAELLSDFLDARGPGGASRPDTPFSHRYSPAGHGPAARAAGGG
jgi:pimeloyl-ACP methyl ester carboxylesterase